MIEYQEVSLQDVLNYYSKDFKPVKGEIFASESFVDIRKGKVIFKLFIREVEKTKAEEK